MAGVREGENEQNGCRRNRDGTTSLFMVYLISRLVAAVSVSVSHSKNILLNFEIRKKFQL